DLVLPLHRVDLVDPPGVIEDALGQGRLARVDVGRDADVADEVDVRHVFCALLEIAVWNKRCRSANFPAGSPPRSRAPYPGSGETASVRSPVRAFRTPEAPKRHFLRCRSALDVARTRTLGRLPCRTDGARLH